MTTLVKICNVCSTTMLHVHTDTILSRYTIAYFSCPTCFLVQTETPYWLAEAYSDAIAATDTGLVARNLSLANQLTFLLEELFSQPAHFLDVAGGTGLLTRLMRDRGFQFFREDPYCVNSLAPGFDANRDSTGFTAITAFEALEHMAEPFEFVRRCVNRSTTGTLIFTTELFAAPIPAWDWWYLSKPTGQHVAFFSEPTLLEIAKRLGLRFLSHRNLHAFTRLAITDFQYRAALDRAEAACTAIQFSKRDSLIQRDHIEITRQLLQARGESSDSIDTFFCSLEAQMLNPTVPSSITEATQSSWVRRTINKWRRSLRKRLMKP